MPNYSCLKSERQAAYTRQKGACCYCTVQMAPITPTGKGYKPNSVSAEHLTQKSRGGRVKNNIVASCKACNAYRPDGMRPSNYAVLRRLLQPIWTPGTNPPKAVRSMLGEMQQAIRLAPSTTSLEDQPHGLE
ncbi:putative endonuclease [Brevundimonas phage vB_BpoS-Kikimora]|uniref:Endonuclease n=1 Tax=Brevundimonas phage vB_BpoS-Kikimora TaxID=2948601 RepID=A0A9E7MRZ9_9CAUD|nr:putative endonuclease [Brevundimonas phage vB_BpoS-Kikimora]